MCSKDAFARSIFGPKGYCLQFKGRPLVCRRKGTPEAALAAARLPWTCNAVALGFSLGVWFEGIATGDGVCRRYSEKGVGVACRLAVRNYAADSVEIFLASPVPLTLSRYCWVRVGVGLATLMPLTQ